MSHTLIVLTPEPVTTAYPEHYPLRYVVTSASGFHRIVVKDTVEEFLDDCSQAWIRGEEDRRLLTEQVAPDGKPVLTPNWPGGTWGGKCGSTVWMIDDTDLSPARFLNALGNRRIDPCEVLGLNSHPSDDHSAAWWVNGSRGPKDGWDGFRTHCDQTYRHDGPCRNGRYVWQMMVGLVNDPVPA